MFVEGMGCLRFLRRCFRSICANKARASSSRLNSHRESSGISSPATKVKTNSPEKVSTSRVRGCIIVKNTFGKSYY